MPPWTQYRVVPQLGIGLALTVVGGCAGAGLLIPMERHNDMTDLAPRVSASRYRLASDLAPLPTAEPAVGVPVPTGAVTSGEVRPSTIPTRRESGPSDSAASSTVASRTPASGVELSRPAGTPQPALLATPSGSEAPVLSRGRGIAEADRLLAEAAQIADRPSGEPDAVRLGRAADRLRELIRRFPDSDKVEHAWVRLGVIAEHPSRQNYTEAVSCYQRAVQAEPISDAWFRAAMLLDGPLGDARLAREMYRGAAQYDPDPERRRQAAEAVRRLSGR